MKTDISAIRLLDKLKIIARGNVGVCSHTDDVRPDDIFIALGEGVRYAQQAIDKGAIAVVVQARSMKPDGFPRTENIYEVEDIDAFVTELLTEVYGDDVANVDLVGVTGTNGKTSCAHFACQLLNLLADKAGYIGTLGYGVVGDELYGSRNTTPDRISLYRYIALLYRSGCKKIVMEVSSHALALNRIAGLKFVTGVFTNLSRDHLDFHRTMQEYEEAKLSFFSDYEMRHWIVNADDMVGEKLVHQWTDNHATGLTCYGKDNKSHHGFYRHVFKRDQVTAQDRLEVQHAGSVYKLPVNISGQYNFENLMAAVLICLACDYTFDEIAGVIAAVQPVPGRLECNKTTHGSKACVDYAHTPAGMEVVLTDRSLLPLESSEVWCVFGCGGDRDRGKRPAMGAAASMYASHIVIADDNVRSEQAEAILCDIVSGVDNKQGLTICRDRKKAITHIVQLAAEDDLVLVLGKGDESHADYGVNKISQRDMAVIGQGVALQ